jgi:hypothetical protein
MISDGCAYANGKVFVEGVGENLLPSAQLRGPWLPNLSVTAPCAGNGHINLFCYLTPYQAALAQAHYQLSGGGVSWRTAVTHGEVGHGEAGR